MGIMGHQLDATSLVLKNRVYFATLSSWADPELLEIISRYNRVGK